MKKSKKRALSVLLSLLLTLSLLPAASLAQTKLDVGSFDLPAVAAPVAGQNGFRPISYTGAHFKIEKSASNAWYTKTNGVYTAEESVTATDFRFPVNSSYYLGLWATPDEGYTFNAASLADYRLGGQPAAALQADENGTLLLWAFPATGGENVPNTTLQSLALTAPAAPVAGESGFRSYTPDAGQHVADIQSAYWGTYEGGEYPYACGFTEKDGVFKSGTEYFLCLKLVAETGCFFSDRYQAEYLLGGQAAVDVRSYDDIAVMVWKFPKTGTASEKTPIGSVAVTVSAPAKGAAPAASAIAGSDAYTVASVGWEPGVTAAFDASTAYTVVFNLETADGTTRFASDVTATVNGGAATVVSGAGSDSLRISYTFPPLQPQITYANILLDEPVTGAAPDTNARREHAGTIESGYPFGYTVTDVTWTPADAVFRPETAYTVSVTLKFDADACVLSSFFTELNGVDCYDENGAKNYDGSGSFTFRHSFAATGAASAAELPFNDVSRDAYYYEPVKWAYTNSVTSGTDSVRFTPELICTRAQVVTFLWRALGSPAPTSLNSPFTDVQDPAAYYYKPVLWAVEKGVTTGTSQTSFGPDESVTRGQFVTFLWRAAGRPEYGTDSPFEDLGISSNFYFDAVLWAYGRNITSGTTANTFSPDGTCSRGQVVTFLYRFKNK